MSQGLSEDEFQRLTSMTYYENELYNQGYVSIAGVDEAGRGPLAGPVVASACILKNNFLLKDLNDSKKLSSIKRKQLFNNLIASKEVIYSIGIVDAKVIDEINVLEATFKAMIEAINLLEEKPDFLLIDGNQLPSIDIPKKGLIKGDTLSLSIAAASIIAKQIRDDIMEKYHKVWPKYDFLNHKGYGTKRHKEAIEKYGICEIHRTSFEPIKSMIINNE